MKTFIIERKDAPIVKIEADHFVQGVEHVTFYGKESDDGRSECLAVFKNEVVTAIYPEDTKVLPND